MACISGADMARGVKRCAGNRGVTRCGGNRGVTRCGSPIIIVPPCYAADGTTKCYTDSYCWIPTGQRPTAITTTITDWASVPAILLGLGAWDGTLQYFATSPYPIDSSWSYYNLGGPGWYWVSDAFAVTTGDGRDGTNGNETMNGVTINYYRIFIFVACGFGSQSTTSRPPHFWVLGSPTTNGTFYGTLSTGGLQQNFIMDLDGGFNNPTNVTMQGNYWRTSAFIVNSVWVLDGSLYGTPAGCESAPAGTGQYTVTLFPGP